MMAAMRRLAEARIEDAMREGKFDNLEGAGRPLDLEPAPAMEEARLQWWALRILKQNDVIPDEVKWRKALDHLKGQVRALTDESKLEALVEKVNELARKINTLGTSALREDVHGMDLEAERVRLRQRLGLP